MGSQRIAGPFRKKEERLTGRKKSHQMKNIEYDWRKGSPGKENGRDKKAGLWEKRIARQGGIRNGQSDKQERKES
jgi:hypothetical protein